MLLVASITVAIALNCFFTLLISKKLPNKIRPHEDRSTAAFGLTNPEKVSTPIFVDQCNRDSKGSSGEISNVNDVVSQHIYRNTVEGSQLSHQRTRTQFLYSFPSFYSYPSQSRTYNCTIKPSQDTSHHQLPLPLPLPLPVQYFLSVTSAICEYILTLQRGYFFSQFVISRFLSQFYREVLLSMTA